GRHPAPAHLGSVEAGAVGEFHRMAGLLLPAASLVERLRLPRRAERPDLPRCQRRGDAHRMAGRVRAHRASCQCDARAGLAIRIAPEVASEPRRSGSSPVPAVRTPASSTTRPGLLRLEANPRYPSFGRTSASAVWPRLPRL